MTKHTMGIRHMGPSQQSVAAPNGKASSAMPDNDSHDPAPPNLTRLRALSRERPCSKMALIRRSWPDILAALRAGHSLKRVCERLSDEGIPIGYRTLCSYVSRLRRDKR